MKNLFLIFDNFSINIKWPFILLFALAAALRGNMNKDLHFLLFNWNINNSKSYSKTYRLFYLIILSIIFSIRSLLGILVVLMQSFSLNPLWNYPFITYMKMTQGSEHSTLQDTSKPIDFLSHNAVIICFIHHFLLIPQF